MTIKEEGGGAYEKETAEGTGEKINQINLGSQKGKEDDEGMGETRSIEHALKKVMDTRERSEQQSSGMGNEDKQVEDPST